jgi:hypothetical protein
MGVFDDEEYQFVLSDYDFNAHNKKEAVVEEAPQEALHKEEGAPLATPVKEDIDMSSEPSPTEEEKPKRKTKPLTREELEKLSNRQKTCEEWAESLLEKMLQLVSLCSNNQLPKGTSLIISHFGHVTDTATATRALADYYLETNEDYQSIKGSGLKSLANLTYNKIQVYDLVLREALDKFENMIKTGEERVVLNQRIRAIKKWTLSLNVHAESQAQAFSVAIESYSPDMGSLPLLKRFAERNDRKVMTGIDNTLGLTGTSMVLVEDSPAMIEAMGNDDTETIIRLQKKLIDYLIDKK